MDQEEIALIRKAQRGDSMAFESLVRKYDKRVLSLALDMLGNIEDAQDIYQEVFIRAFCSLPKFRFQSEFFTWLYRITINYTINFRKKKSYRASFYIDSRFAESEDSHILGVDMVSSPDQDVESKDFHKHLNRALDSLPIKQRSVFILRYFHDQKLAEIAETMDCKLGTVKNSLFRATQKIKQHFAMLEL